MAGLSDTGTGYTNKKLCTAHPKRSQAVKFNLCIARALNISKLQQHDGCVDSRIPIELTSSQLIAVGVALTA